MLVRQNGGRHENRDLAIRLYGLERRTHGDLGLAVSDVANEEAIHGPWLFHVLLDVDGGFPLIRRILEEERRLELSLPRGVGEMRGPGGDLSAGVEVEQLDRHLLDRGARLVSLLRPPLSAELVEARRHGFAVGVARGTVPLDLVDAVEGHVEAVATFVLDDRDLDGALADEDRLQSAVDADAVLEMHDEVAGLERGNGLERRAGCITPRAAKAALPTKDLVVGEDAKP